MRWPAEGQTLLSYQAVSDSVLVVAWGLSYGFLQARHKIQGCPPLYTEEYCKAAALDTVLSPILSFALAPLAAMLSIYFLLWRSLVDVKFVGSSSDERRIVLAERFTFVVLWVHLFLLACLTIAAGARSMFWMLPLTLFAIIQDVHLLKRVGAGLSQRGWKYSCLPDQDQDELKEQDLTAGDFVVRRRDPVDDGKGGSLFWWKWR